MERITTWLEDRYQQMLELLEALVNQDSGSYDKTGVDATGVILQRFLASHGVACERIPLSERGDCFRAVVPGRKEGPPVMLLGHRDTVFPAGEAARRPFRIEGDRAYGPGVADMKAGLVMNAFVLAAFAVTGGAPMPLVGLFTGDEEIGSLGSRPVIEREAKAARCVFNAEPGRISGNVVTGRRGGIFFRCDVSGKAAHAGLNFDDGRSAILAIARKIQAWMALPEQFPGITVNVGTVSGGLSVNTVAPHATCDIDLRYEKLEGRERLISAIEAIAQQPSVEGTTATIRMLGEFMPMAQSSASRELFQGYIQAAQSIGLEIGGEYTRSCADSGLTAAVGTPTLCATGPVGGNAHSPEEYVELSTIIPRTLALALTVAALPVG